MALILRNVTTISLHRVEAEASGVQTVPEDVITANILIL
jgi:hypothetical protein